MKAVVLFSGGLDSTTCLALAVKKYGSANVLALSISYGQKHDKETECAEKIAKYYNVDLIKFDAKQIFEGSDCTLIKGNDSVPDGDYEEQQKEREGQPVSTYVPFRNGLFLSIATSIALSRGYDIVIYGAHKDDVAGNAYPDCSVIFNHFMASAINEGTGGEIRLNAPFIHSNKTYVVRKGIELDVPYEMTWSCYKGGDKPCGKCGTCIDRIKAFKENGKEDPLQYEED